MEALPSNHGCGCTLVDSMHNVLPKYSERLPFHFPRRHVATQFPQFPQLPKLLVLPPPHRYSYGKYNRGTLSAWKQYERIGNDCIRGIKPPLQNAMEA